MVGGAAPDVSQVQRNHQRVFVTDRVAGIEIKTLQQYVVPLGDAGRIDPHMNERIARIGVDQDTAMLIPFSRALHSLRVAGPGQNVAGGDHSGDQGKRIQRYHGGNVKRYTPRPGRPWGTRLPPRRQYRYATPMATLT